MPSPTATRSEAPPPPATGGALFLRIILAALTAILAVNLYTGAPLLAIWIGSRVQQGTQLTMGTVAVVIGVLIATVALLVFLLTRVEAMYKAVTGQGQEQRRVAPWMRSMRGDRGSTRQRGVLDTVMVVSVGCALALFGIWFFGFAGSSLPGG